MNESRTDDETASFALGLSARINTMNVSVLYVTDVLLTNEQVCRWRARRDRSACADHHEARERAELTDRRSHRQCSPHHSGSQSGCPLDLAVDASVFPQTRERPQVRLPAGVCLLSGG